MDQITDNAKSFHLYRSNKCISINTSFYEDYSGNNFPADSKFGRIKDNLRLTSTTHSYNGPQRGPRTSMVMYAYNVPDIATDPNALDPTDQGTNPSTGQPVGNQDDWFRERTQ